MFHDLTNYDVFNSWLLEGAEYTDGIELPVLKGSNAIPDSLCLFSEAVSKSGANLESWPCMYEHDVKFVRIWRNPKRYIPILLRHPGIIGPDFSMYRNMPSAMQQWSCFMGRAIAHRVEYDGGTVIPNIRWADERSFEYCFSGLPLNSTYAVGTHGCIKLREDRYWFERGLSELAERLNPEILIVYGAAPESIFSKFTDAGVRVVQFDSRFAIKRKGVN